MEFVHQAKEGKPVGERSARRHSKGDLGTFMEAQMSVSKHICDSAKMGGVGQAKQVMKNRQNIFMKECQCTGINWEVIRDTKITENTAQRKVKLWEENHKC